MYLAEGAEALEIETLKTMSSHLRRAVEWKE
jgi:hypothetical protein